MSDAEDLAAFEPDPDAEFVWMQHEGTQPAQIPAGAAKAWRQIGWEPCDPPAEINPALVEYQPPAVLTTGPDKKSRKNVSEGVSDA